MPFVSLFDRRPAVVVVAAVMAAFLVPAGCGRRDLHRVTGRVSFPDGSPLTTGRIVVAYGNGTSAWGRVKPDGSFTIGTLKESDGMLAGRCRVAVKDALLPIETPGEFKTAVHPRFADPATSGLEFEVPKQTKWQIVVEKP